MPRWGRDVMQKERASLREKLSYGTGAVAYCIETTLILTYLMLFCSDVLRINVAIIGVIMTVVKVLDAISDLIITSIADRGNSRWGKYRIWILNGIPLAVCVLLMFWSPVFLTSELSKALWVLAIYLVMTPILETAIVCPFMAMNVTMSEDTKDRLDFSNARALGESTAQIILSLIAMPIILYFGGYKNILGWRVMSAVVAVIIVICTLNCFFGTKERIYVSYEDAEGHQIKWREKFRPILGNRPFWKLMTIIFFLMAHAYASSSLFAYICIYNLGHEEWVSPLLTTGFAVQTLITGALFYLGRRFEKRVIMLAGGLCVLIANCCLVFANGFAMAAAYEVLLGTGNGLFMGISFAMLTDVADYTEWKSGIVLPGIISAFATFAMKFGGAVTTSLVGAALTFSHYDELLSVQSAYTCRILLLSLIAISGVSILLSMVMVWRMKEITSQLVTTYRKEIDARIKR